MTTVSCPDGIEAINEYYTNPDQDGDGVLDPEWVSNNTAVYELPIPLRLSWDPTRRAYKFRAHRYVGDAMVEALKEIAEYRGPIWLSDEDLDFYGGVYNFRVKTGGRDLSTHAWGIAIDLNPHRGKFGQPSDMPEFIVKAFGRRGFAWGGSWPAPYTDGMHFSACVGY